MIGLNISDDCLHIDDFLCIDDCLDIVWGDGS